MPIRSVKNRFFQFARPSLVTPCILVFVMAIVVVVLVVMMLVTPCILVFVMAIVVVVGGDDVSDPLHIVVCYGKSSGGVGGSVGGGCGGQRGRGGVSFGGRCDIRFTRVDQAMLFS
jgi:uncharacterized membrane protein YgcG